MPSPCLSPKLLLGVAFAAIASFPAISQTAAPAGSAAAANVETAALEEIVVTGVRGSLMRSVEAKRIAATIIDSISAEELGKFPSRNVADALVNIPGVTVERTSGGEGQRISIRGLGGDFNITTLNGRILAVEDSGREFSFDVLPSEMIAGADVYKAVQAQALEGTLGGAVDLRSARPFDFKGLHLAGSVEGEYGTLPGKWGKKISGVISNTFDDGRMGALLTVSYSKRATRTDNLHEISSTAGTEQDWNVDFNGIGGVGDTNQQYIFPQFYSVGTILGDHKRLGVSGAFQFKPNDRMLLTVDGLYGHYDASTQNYASSNHVTPREDQEPGTLADPTALKWDPLTIRADANGVITNFSMNQLVAEVLDDTNARAVTTRLFGGNLRWDVTDRLQLTGDAYLSEAARNSGGLDRFVVAGITDASGVFATRNSGLPDLQITLADGRSLDQATNADYRPHYIGIYGDNLKDRVNSGKVDGKLALDWGSAKTLKFGVNFTDRRKSSAQIDNNDTACQFCGYPFTFADIGANVVQPLPITGLLGDLPGNFPRNFATFNIDTYLNSLFLAEQNPNLVIYCPPANDPCPPGQLTEYPAGYAAQVLAPDLPASFDVDEKTTAAYLQFDFSGDRWRGDIGLRLVHTKVLSTGYSKFPESVTKLPASADYTVVFTNLEPVQGGGSYTKPLPAINFAYDIRPDLRLRLAASKVLSRPSLVQLTPASDWSNWASGSFITYFLGNPNLKPTDSTQWDTSLEWYINSRSYVSAALYYKRLKNFVTGASVQKVFHDPSGQDYPYFEEDVVNGDSGTVRGAEVMGQYLFDNGFGVVANLTATSSTSSLGGVSGKLPGVIPHSYNLKLLYEKFGWSNQVSYSYTSSFTHDLDSPYIPGLPIVSDAYKDLSATVSYAFGRHVTAYVEGSNILNNADFRFSTYRNVPSYYEAWGRAYFVGLRARL